MPVSVQTAINLLEKLAPKKLAYEWDNAGLQLGSLQGDTSAIYVTLDVTEQTLAEAESLGARLVISHHPLFFKPLKAVRTDLPAGRIVQKALAAKITIYAAHTNLDLAKGGVNDALAARLGLAETTVLRRDGQHELEKLVVFVPRGYEDDVHRAMSAAGAGWIGQYSHCSFQVPGTGTFLPREGAKPFLGEEGKLEKAAEIRLETIVPSGLRKRVIRAMLDAHPYEEVAYDIYPLRNDGEAYGLGRIGILQQPCSLPDFCQFVKDRLQIPFLRVAGSTDRLVRKVAVCGGTGSELLQAAAFAGADVLVTSDVKYHEAQEAWTTGVAVIDAGHDATERVIVPVLRDYLQEQLQTAGHHDVKVFASTIETSPWQAF
ncbi:MAG: Nif3-like dinuclear metal center hexameric protein [Firmicutes bacterium]|nr:Nif3-like dinuclear metal center hexameric protein [Bacillota bacterium]